MVAHTNLMWHAEPCRGYTQPYRSAHSSAQPLQLTHRPAYAPAWAQVALSLSVTAPVMYERMTLVNANFECTLHVLQAEPRLHVELAQ